MNESMLSYKQVNRIQNLTNETLQTPKKQRNDPPMIKKQKNMILKQEGNMRKLNMIDVFENKLGVKSETNYIIQLT